MTKAIIGVSWIVMGAIGLILFGLFALFWMGYNKITS